MAKPEFASQPARRSDTSIGTPSRPSNRVNRAPRSRSRYSSPSPSAIFALLATVSASPLVAHAYPLEPPQTAFPFLYPPFLRQSTPSLEKRSTTPSTSNPAPSTTSSPPPPPSACPQDGPRLPDNYVLGDDGRWHKTDWSLYGSTYCAGPCSPPSSLPDTLQNDINNPPGPGPSPPPDDFDLSTLPTGWSDIHTNVTSRHSTIIILALSVALSMAIIVMMFSFIFWRRKRGPKRDPEKNGRRTPSIADDDSTHTVREAKARQRKWYKAASRWRENVRFSARRRRTNRVLASTPSYTTLSPQEVKTETVAADTESTTYGSRPSSPTATLRSVSPDVYTSSRASIRSSHSQTQTTHALASQSLPTDPPPPPPLSPLSSQPPAYHSRSSYLPCHDSPEFMSSTSKAPLSSPTQPRPHDVDDGHITSLSGHVATDDKAILSRRTALASAPPGSDSNISQLASVPSMEDEDMYELPPGLPPSSPTHDAYGYEPHPPYSPPTTLLPPPPSKGKQKFDYTHDWDISLDIDNATVEPQLGPSAPPLEESEVMPSAPPLDSDVHVHVPSAPPLDTEDECPEATTGRF